MKRLSRSQQLLRIILSYLVLSCLSVPAVAGALNRFKYTLSPWLTTELDVSYGTHPEEKLDVISPVSHRRAPAVILIHGGGWSVGDKINIAGDATRMAKAGFVVFNINYRLAKFGETDTRWPAQLQDAQLAVRWIRKNAGRYNVDPEKICAVGASAGGQLSMFLGYAHEIQPGDREQELRDFAPDVNCVVNIFGPANLTHESVLNAYSKLPFVSGGSQEEAEQRLRQASPLFLINKNSAPTFIIQPKADRIVPPPLAKELVETLKKKNVSHIYLEVEGGHGFENTPVNEQTYAREAFLEFLKDNLLPSPSETRATRKTSSKAKKAH